jgi:lipid-binding SYLF domain-containing protein
MTVKTIEQSTWWQSSALAIVMFAVAALPVHARAGTGDRSSLTHEAETTVEDFRRTDPELARFFDGAVGYAVFPTVDKGAAGVGGAYGKGVLFERGHAIGKSTLTQVTVGPQLGGQAYSEIVFFETPEAIAAFKKGEFTMAAQVSAVISAAGASAQARYARGVAVFTLAKAGLMAEVSIGGQKFAYERFPHHVKGRTGK